MSHKYMEDRLPPGTFLGIAIFITAYSIQGSSQPLSLQLDLHNMYTAHAGTLQLPVMPRHHLSSAAVCFQYSCTTHCSIWAVSVFTQSYRISFLAASHREATTHSALVFQLVYYSWKKVCFFRHPYHHSDVFSVVFTWLPLKPDQILVTAVAFVDSYLNTSLRHWARTRFVFPWTLFSQHIQILS